MGALLADYRPAADGPGASRDVDQLAPPGAEMIEWPVRGAASGWSTFLAKYGIQDALVAFTPDTGQPRSVFLVGLAWLKGRPDQIRRLVSAAQRLWEAPDQKEASFVDLCPVHRTVPPSGHAEVVLPDRLVSGSWPSPLDPFCQAVVAREVSGPGRLHLLMLRRVHLGRLDGAGMEAIHTALPLLLDAMYALCAEKRAEQRSALVHAMFDQMTLPTLVVDAAAKPVMVNRAARDLLGRRTVLLRAADGSITGRSTRESRALRTAIAKAAGADPDLDGNMEAVRLSDGCEDWLLAVVMPTRPCLEANVAHAATVVIHEPRRDPTPPCILSALGLLPSEQRFVEAFLQSDSLGEAAERSNISPETARTYLKRVRTKLGAHRQMDLARLIQGLVPPITPNPAASAGE